MVKSIHPRKTTGSALGSETGAFPPPRAVKAPGGRHQLRLKPSLPNHSPSFFQLPPYILLSDFVHPLINPTPPDPISPRPLGIVTPFAPHRSHSRCHSPNLPR